MKKRIGIIIVLCIMTCLGACGKVANNFGEKVLETVEQNKKQSGNDMRIMFDDKKLYRLDDNNIPVELAVDDSCEKVEVRDFAQVENEICVLYSVLDENNEDVEDKVAILDRNGVACTVKLDTNTPIYSTVVVAVEGQFYLSYAQFGETYAYNFSTFLVDASTGALVETDKFSLVESMLEENTNNAIFYGEPPLKAYKKYGHFVYRNGEADAVFSDVSGEKKYSFTPVNENGTINIDYADEKGAVLYETIGTDISSMVYEYYVDFETEKTYKIGEGIDFRAFAKARYENNLIIVENKSDEYGVSEFEYSLLDTTSGDRTVLFKDTVYGNSYSLSENYSNTYMFDDLFYYQKAEDDKCEWSVCNLASDGYDQTATGSVIFSNPATEFGSLLHASKTYYFEPGEEVNFIDCFTDNGVENYETFFADNKCKSFAYYVEGFQLNSDVKNASKINAKLKDRFDEKISENDAQADSVKEMFIDSGYYPSYGTFSTNNETVDSVTFLGNKFVQIGYAGYDYMGGAHGLPYYAYYLYSLDTAEQVKFSDIYKGTDENFAELVAQYSMETYENNPDVFYENYEEYSDESAGGLRQQFYDGASTEMQGYFTDESYVIEYSPYEYGPYAAGFIKVSIPLSKLGINF